MGFPNEHVVVSESGVDYQIINRSSRGTDRLDLVLINPDEKSPIAALIAESSNIPGRPGNVSYKMELKVILRDGVSSNGIHLSENGNSTISLPHLKIKGIPTDIHKTKLLSCTPTELKQVWNMKDNGFISPAMAQAFEAFNKITTPEMLSGSFFLQGRLLAPIADLFPKKVEVTR